MDTTDDEGSIFEDISESDYELSIADQTNISPVRGRSVKEYDEELTALRKENFNLKLRIYFLEERMGPTYNIEDKDNVVRKNIEYQVELESLRKELEDKQDLLCQALKAMELEETEHKKLVTRKDQQILELNERLESIQKDTTTLTEMNDMLVQKQNRLLEDSSAMYTEAFNLQDANCKTKMEIEQLQQQISDLETQLAEERQQNQLYETNLQETEILQNKIQNLELELKERDCKINKLSTDCELKGHTISSLNLKVRTLEDDLKSKLDDIEIRESELRQQQEIIKEQLYDIDEYKKKLTDETILNDKEQRQIETLKSNIISRDNTIAELESKLERCKSVIRNLEAKLEKIAHENKRKDEEIMSMKSQRRAASVNESRIWSPKPDHRNNSDYLNEKAETDDVRSLREALKKKDEQYKNACSMVQSFILSRKSLERENAELQSQVEKKDIKIIELQKEVKRFNNQFFKNYDGLSNSFNKHQGSPQNNRPDYDEDSGNEQTQPGESMANGEKLSMDCENHLEVLMQMLEEKDNQLQEYKEMLESATSSLKNKDNRITELEKELSELHIYLTDLRNQFEEFKTLKIQGEGDEKDKRIEQLESEIKKHTHNLQGIVNTELWEKNREIEKLQNRLTEKVKAKDTEISKLEKELMGKDLQLKILKEKIEELGIHVNIPSSLMTLNFDEGCEIPEEISVLKEKLKLSNEKVKYLQKTVEELNSQLKNTPERENDTKFTDLKSQYSQLQSEFDKSEKCRQEMGNVCILLTNRLEELANFLDSLLKHKSVLGLLGIKQQSAIKTAIDQSLDISKTFNISLINEDKSLAQLSSLSGFLNHSINATDMSLHESYFDISDEKRQSMVGNHGNLTFNSHLSHARGDAQNPQEVIKEQKEIIGVLRQQIETLKKEIEVRDTEIAHHNINSTDVEKSLKNDQELVEALMDLQNNPNRNLEVLSPGKIYQNLFDKKNIAIQNDQSESEAWSEPDRNVSQARIGLDVESLKSSNNTSRSKSKHSDDSFTSSSSKYSSSRSPSKRSVNERTINALQENITSLEKQLKEKENENLTLQCRLMENDNKIKESQLKLHEEIEKVRNDKYNLENVQKMSQKLIESLETQKEDLLTKIAEITVEKENLLAQINLKDTQIENLIQKTKSLELSVAQNEETVSKRLQENDAKWKEIYNKMESEAEIRINELKETTNQLREKYENHYIEKGELEKQNKKLKMVYQELETIKSVVQEAEQKEFEVNKKLQDIERENREKIIALKRELNEYALRTSQAVLERTKVSNEKLRLEQEVRRLEARENEKISELSEKEKQYHSMKNTIQKQISQLESQKSHLQLKVSELETEKAELQNRVIRLQNGETTTYSKSTPSTPIKIAEHPNFLHLGKHSLGNRYNYIKPKSDMSGYNSEEHFTDDNDHFNRSAPEGCNWFVTNLNHNPSEVSAVRNIANSSPDLGIESDPGRFSSLETNVSRPLLQTLELTASMNNLLSENHNDHKALFCNIPSHKTLLKENEELQRKLEKTTTQLDIINKNKKQVEKAVCKQIHKTSIVLRKARANLDSGSENELLRK